MRNLVLKDDTNIKVKSENPAFSFNGFNQFCPLLKRINLSKTEILDKFSESVYIINPLIDNNDEI